MNEREHAVLSLFYDEGNREVTPSFLAYRMRISIRDATALLDDMVKTDILDLHVDDEGHIVYRLPAGERQRMHHYQPDQGLPDEGESWPEPEAQPSHRPPAGPTGGTDATPGYGATPHTVQGTTNHRTNPDGTDGSLYGSAVTSSTSASPTQPPQRQRQQPPHQQPPHQQPSHQSPSAPTDTRTYEEWYAAGERGAFGHQPPSSDQAAQLQQFGTMPEQHALTPYQSRQTPARRRPSGSDQPRIPVLAGALSLLVPGLGQFYNGEIGKGVMLLFSCLFLWVFLLFWIVWIWSVIDAYMVAAHSNQRGLHDDTSSRPMLPDHRAHGANRNSNVA